MSSPSSLWEFVHCMLCFVEWSPDTKFWATECGHVLCNDHLNSDGSCSLCRTKNAQLSLLRNDPSDPMLQWLQPISKGLESVIYQIDTLTSLVRHYRQQSHQHNLFRTKVRASLESARALRKEVHALRNENARLRGTFWDANDDPEQILRSESSDNQAEAVYIANSKRRFMETPDSGIASSTPSNYSVSTPARSLRLTLPAGRPASTVLESATRARYENQRSQFPQLSSNDNLRQYAYTPVSHSSIPQRTLQHRPASSLASKHMPPPPIPYERSGPGPGADESRTNPSANPEGPAHKRFRTPVFSNSRWPGSPDAHPSRLVPAQKSTQLHPPVYFPTPQRYQNNNFTEPNQYQPESDPRRPRDVNSLQSRSGTTGVPQQTVTAASPGIVSQRPLLHRAGLRRFTTPASGAK